MYNGRQEKRVEFLKGSTETESKRETHAVIPKTWGEARRQTADTANPAEQSRQAGQPARPGKLSCDT